MTIQLSQEIYLLVGVPGSGKSWICERAKPNYEYISHDAHIGGRYIPAIIEAATQGTKPVLIETPFSMARVMEPLSQEGLTVIPIFVIEAPDELERRWNSRGTPPSARKGHLTRQVTYQARVGEYHAFSGDSMDVLSHLNLLAAERENNEGPATAGTRQPNQVDWSGSHQ